MSLTAEEKVKVQESWEIVKKDFKANSVAFFLFFFKQNPGLQDKFKSFKGKPLDDIKESIKLKSHASRVFHAVSSLIDNLDDLELVQDILQRTTQDHVPRQIEPEHFEKLFNSIVAFLSEALGDAFCEVTRSGWLTVASIMMSVITEESNRLKAE